MSASTTVGATGPGETTRDGTATPPSAPHDAISTAAGGEPATCEACTPPSAPDARRGVDDFGRTIDYLRIAITDRCNYRCVYCMPTSGVHLMKHERMLSYEEIVRFVRIATEFGIKHLRLTGGEPLARKGCVELASMLSALPGIEDIAITTNGSLLPKLARPLVEAGVSRVNISLDTLDPETFHAVTRVGHLEDALAGIDAALEAGFKTVKVNCVAVRSLKQDVLGMAKLSVDRPLHVRFIEYMPIGSDDMNLLTQGEDAPAAAGHDRERAHISVADWSAQDTIPSDELRKMISKLGEADGVGALLPASEKRPTGYGPADYWKFAESQGTVGFISAMSNHFCKTCNRLRLTADGCIRPCLFSDAEVSVHDALRDSDDDAVRAAFREALRIKPDAHHTEGTERYMSQIGG